MPIDVNAIFSDYNGDVPESNIIPARVLENRRRRAQLRLQDALDSYGSVVESTEELEQEVRRLVQRWAALSFADAFDAMEAFEIRCARKHELFVAQSSGDQEAYFQALAVDYRRRVVEQYSRIELRGIQTSERIYFDLSEIFVPLYLAEPARGAK